MTEQLQVLTQLVGVFEDIHDRLEFDGPPSPGDAAAWCDERDITDEQIRKDIAELAGIGENALSDLTRARARARGLLRDHPAAERLTMPEAS